MAKFKQLWNLDNRKYIPLNVEIAETLIQRTIGLMGRKTMEIDTAMWIAPCGSIHTCFVKFPIDAVFINAEGAIMRITEALPPWRIGGAPPKCRAVLELPAGGAARAGLKVGTHILLTTSGKSDLK